MSEADWAVTLEVVRGCCSRRGDKGRDGRLLLGALRCFAVHNVTWRALPAGFGTWEQRLGAALAAGPLRCARGLPRRPGLAQRDGASGAGVRLDRGAGARLGGRGPRGQDGQALGRSRGGFSTKIHVKADFAGRPLAFPLTGGAASDSRPFETLLDIGPDLRPRAALTGKGGDAQGHRAAARERGIGPVIPRRDNAADRPGLFPRPLDRGRARIEQAIGKLKRFNRAALRGDKTAQSYAASVALARTVTLAKSAHTA
jgi:transposase